VAWCGDITYIKTGRLGGDLATVIDLHSGSWCVGRWTVTCGPVWLPKRCRWRWIGGMLTGRDIPSDRGTQYTSGEFADFVIRTMCNVRWDARERVTITRLLNRFSRPSRKS
jgi:hypothetical protein